MYEEKVRSVMYNLVYRISYFLVFMELQSFENKKRRSPYRTSAGLREWAGGPFMEPCILLQIASAVQTHTAVT